MIVSEPKKDSPDLTEKIIRGIRITARFLASILFLMIAVFAVTEGLPNPLRMTFDQNLTLLTFLIIMAGMAIAWTRESYGGIAIIIGYVIFVIANPFPLPAWIAALFPITGLLFLASWWGTDRLGKRE